MRSYPNIKFMGNLRAFRIRLSISFIILSIFPSYSIITSLQLSSKVTARKLKSGGHELVAFIGKDDSLKKFIIVVENGSYSLNIKASLNREKGSPFNEITGKELSQSPCRKYTDRTQNSETIKSGNRET